MQLHGKSFYAACNQASVSSITDAFSSAAFSLPRGNAVRFYCALFNGDPKSEANFIDDLGNITSATIVLRKDSATGDILFQQTVAVADFHNTGCTFADWSSKSDYQFGFALSADQTNWDMTGWQGGIYLVIGINTTGEGPITVANAKIGVYEDGIGGGSDTVVNNPSYMSTDEIRAYVGTIIGSSCPAILTGITGLTGGDTTNLDGVATVGLATGYVALFSLGGLQAYQLQSSTAATAAPGLIRPVDYNASTNARVWVQIN